jgi:hypothetical protein
MVSGGEFRGFDFKGSPGGAKIRLHFAENAQNPTKNQNL